MWDRMADADGGTTAAYGSFSRQQGLTRRRAVGLVAEHVRFVALCTVLTNSFFAFIRETNSSRYLAWAAK